MSDLVALRRYVRYRWRLVKRWLDAKIYVEDNPEDVEWADQLASWNDRFDSEDNVFYLDGVKYRRTWAGVFKV